MDKYTCYVCKVEFDTDKEIPEVDKDEVLLCGTCADAVARLTGIRGVDITDE